MVFVALHKLSFVWIILRLEAMLWFKLVLLGVL